MIDLKTSSLNELVRNIKAEYSKDQINILIQLLKESEKVN